MASQKFLDPPPAAKRDPKAFELLRVWVAEEEQQVALRAGAWEDPYAWGVVLADLARHIVNAEALADPSLDRNQYLQRLLEGFDDELQEPGDETEGEMQQ